MDIIISQAKGRVPVTVIKTQGNVDGSNYEQLIDMAKAEIDAGAHDVLLDLAETAYMSTAGMLALQSIARMLRGEAATNPEAGWSAIHALEHEREQPQTHLKLLNPQPRVAKSLDLIGFTPHFPVFTDRDEAIASF
jgi:anti-anti-sigma regulatory factor